MLLPKALDDGKCPNQILRLNGKGNVCTFTDWSRLGNHVDVDILHSEFCHDLGGDRKVSGNVVKADETDVFGHRNFADTIHRIRSFLLEKGKVF